MLFQVASFAFGQEADLSIELEVRPSKTLAIDQIGFLDVTITNHGPSEKRGSFFIINEFPAVKFGNMVSGQCTPGFFEPPPPGVPFFVPLDTPVLASGESERCTIEIQFDGNEPQSVTIFMKVIPWLFQQNDDPNESNNEGSVTVTFANPQPIPTIGAMSIFLLIGLMCMLAAIHISKKNNSILKS